MPGVAGVVLFQEVQGRLAAHPGLLVLPGPQPGLPSVSAAEDTGHLS